jgi:hypothetical protein
MSNEALTTDRSEAAEVHEATPHHPAGEIRLPGAPSVGRRARLLAGMTSLNDQSTITSTSISAP